MSTAMSVLGPIPGDQLGHTQPHEHLLSDLTGYLPEAIRNAGTPVTLSNYTSSRLDRDNAVDMRLDSVDTAIDELRRYRQAGGNTIVEATPDGVGRRPADLAAIATASGVTVIMGAGWYAAPFHPAWTTAATTAALTERLEQELMEGDPDTGIRAGIIGEIGMSWPPDPAEEKVLTAAAHASSSTGAAILVHPGRHADAPAHHLDVLRRAGADLNRVIMSHIDRTLFTIDDMLRLADHGCVLEFDLFGTESSYYPQDPTVDLPNDGTRVRYIRQLLEHGHHDQVVIAEDVCRKTQLVSHGGEGYEHILRRVLPLMTARGISAADIHRITVTTPRRLLAYLP